MNISILMTLVDYFCIDKALELPFLHSLPISDISASFIFPVYASTVFAFLVNYRIVGLVALLAT